MTTNGIQVESPGSAYMKGGDPTLASSLGGSRGVPVPLHYEQPGSPGSQVTLYGTGGAGSYPYGKPTTTGGGGGGGGGEYWSNAGTPSPPTFDCVSGYQNVTAISVGDASNIQLYSGGAYSVSAGGTTTVPSPWSNLPLTGEEAAFDGTIVADPKECFGCGIPTTAWRRDETGRYYCPNCIYNKMNGVNMRPAMRCGKPKQPVAPVNFLLLFLLLILLLLLLLLGFLHPFVASVDRGEIMGRKKEKRKRTNVLSVAESKQSLRDSRRLLFTLVSTPRTLPFSRSRCATLATLADIRPPRFGVISLSLYALYPSL